MLVVEYGHKYMDKELTDNDYKLKEKVFSLLELFLKKDEKVKYVSLLDDLHVGAEVFTEIEYKEVYEFQNSLLSIFRESEMIKYASLEFDKLKHKCKKEYFRKENKYVYFYITDKNNKIAVKEEKRNEDIFYCVFLSYVWSIFKNKYGLDADLLTIIEKEYKPIEDNVNILLTENDYDINNYYIYI